jgi:single-strand DNA-binding protein
VKENYMRDIATATLSGNLTRDVELRTLPSGVEVGRMRVASTTRRRNGEEWVEKANYFTVEVYGVLASACAEHLAKGSRVLVDAELEWRERTDLQNNRHEAVTLRGRQVIFEGGRPPAGRGEDGGEHSGSAASAAEPGTPVGVAPASEASAGADDLPF